MDPSTVLCVSCDQRFGDEDRYMETPAPLKWARMRMNSVTGRCDLPEGQECYYCEAAFRHCHMASRIRLRKGSMDTLAWTSWDTMAPPSWCSTDTRRPPVHALEA